MNCRQPQPGHGDGLPEEIVEAAIDWVLKIRFNTPDEKTRQAFEDWLQSDTRHAEAWQRMDSAQKGFDVLPGRDILNVFETVEKKRRDRNISRRKAIKIGLLGGIFLVSAGWGISYRFSGARESMTAATPIGGRRTLRFSEGSLVELNTATGITAEFTLRRRRIQLLRGEVFITTGKDAGSFFHRPFVVNTPYGSLEALGTKFCVRIMPGHARICVLEDAVRISAAGYKVMARAKETWQMGSQDIRLITGPVPGATDWIDGIIVAKGMPLSKLLAELSRYRSGDIGWDHHAARLKAFGIYQVNDPDKALQILSQTLPIKMVPQAGNRIFISCSPQ